MKRLKQNILSMIAVAVFAIFAAVIEGSFVYDYDVELKTAGELSDAAFDQSSTSEPLFFSRENTSESVLLTRRAGQQALSRTLRSESFQGFCGRDAGTYKRISARTQQRISAQSLVYSAYPTPLAFQASKDYYVFTLKRILC